MNAQRSSTRTQPGTGGGGEFTPRQMQGLARLGDLVFELDQALAGPLGGVAAGGLNRGLDLFVRYDVPELVEPWLQTLRVLNDSGLLALLRDNAYLIRETLAAAEPALERLAAHLRTLSPEELETELKSLWHTLKAWEQASRFASQALAPEVSRFLVRTGEFIQQNRTDEAVVGLMETLGRLHRNGTLNRLAELSDYLAATVEPLEGDVFLESVLASLRRSGLPRALQLVSGLEEAAAETRREADHAGGLGGMFHLLRDPDVQQGLRLLGSLPAFLHATAPAGTGQQAPEARTAHS